MNDSRRKRIVEAAEQLRTISEAIRDIAAEEQEAFDNMPESIQASDGGQKMEEAAMEIETLADDAANTADELKARAWTYVPGFRSPAPRLATPTGAPGPGWAMPEN